MYTSPQVCAGTRSAPGSAPSWQIGLFGHNNSCICGIANFENLISGRGPQTLIISYFTAAVNSCYSLINRLHEPWTYFVNFPWENWVFTAILAEMLIITITTNWWEIENICNKKKPKKLWDRRTSVWASPKCAFQQRWMPWVVFSPHTKHWKEVVQNWIIWDVFDLNVCKSELFFPFGCIDSHATR